MTSTTWRILLAFAALLAAVPSDAARCLYVSSYHSGYEWNDGLERGMDPILKGRCEQKRFYMDGKRNLDADFARAKGLEAKALIDAWQPDVVIAADDNASKYLVLPYLRNAKVPVVFCGVNWTVEPYGYPYDNATGMIEVGPIEPLLREVRAVVNNARRGVFLSAAEMTQTKEFEMSRDKYGAAGISIAHTAVTTMAAWEQGFLAAQKEADFIIIGNYAGIKDWSGEQARAFVLRHGGKFTVAYLEWMAPYAMLTMSKIADEQGEWAAKVALMILDGVSPRSIPIVANRRWDMFINPRLLGPSGHRLSSEITRKAVKVEP
ncbi:hypothetical protein [Roseateles sp.]|uniref:ABC transporter substrate-binding protein n=1 Tax=Roseateles sp. TaxID=1971397 RepID=UPI00286CA0CB|nr:hypothetical protein [Roseateles sp.]